MGDDQSPDDDEDVPVVEKEAEDCDLSSKESSSAKPSQRKGNGQKPRTVLQFLKDEKDILVTVGFFITGAIWLYGAFATKHYVGDMKCILGATIDRLDNQAQARDYQADTVDLNVRIQELQGSGRPLGQILSELEGLKQKVEDLKGKKRLSDEAAKKAAEKAANGECGE